MRIGRAIIIPAILALGVAGSTVAGSAIAVSSGHLHAHMSGTHVQADGPAASPYIYFHG
jgi:hypothetical protein